MVTFVPSIVRQQYSSFSISRLAMFILLSLVCHFSNCNPVPIGSPDNKSQDPPIVAPIPTPIHCVPSSMTNLEAQLTVFTHHKSLDSCNEMVRKLNNSAPSVNSTCPWRYHCEFKVNRFPQYIIRADCLNSYCEGASCAGAGNEYAALEQRKCRPVGISLDVYECSESTPSFEAIKGGTAGSSGSLQTGEWIKTEVNVGCHCNSLGKR